MDSSDQSLNQQPLSVISEDGRPLKHRLKSVEAGRSLWYRLRTADLDYVDSMAKAQALVDGAQPFPQKARVASGQAYLSNFNPGDAKAFLDSTLSAYYDLINADETLIRLKIRWRNDSEKGEYEDIMSEELSREIRSWPDFPYRYAFIPHYARLHGVAIAYFEDRMNWQWNVTNMAYFKIPRDTRSSEEEINYACMKVNTPANELMRYVRNEEYAKDEGWNVRAVKASLMNANPRYWDAFNAMEQVEKWKNYDFVEGETAPTIPVIYCWVQENDSTFSLYIFTESAISNPGLSSDDNFLCIKQSAFSCAQECFIFFTNGIGTNGTFHSISGMGKDMYNALMQSMRLRNRMCDIAGASGPVFKATTEEAASEMEMVPAGPFMMVSAGLEAMPVTSPSLTATLIPALSDLDSTIRRNLGQYTPDSPFGGNQEKTRTEILANLDVNAGLSVASLGMFYSRLDRLYQEVVRRMTRKGYLRIDPGGHAVHNWRTRCFERGVPIEAIEAVDWARTKASRAIGYGSPAARRVALEAAAPLIGSLDAYGKELYTRMALASILGWEITDELAPRPSKTARPPVDAAIAAEQNNTLTSKGMLLMNPDTQMIAETMVVPVMPNENRQIHLEVHTAKLAEFTQMFDEAGQNPELYAQIVPAMAAIYEHSVETLEGYTGDDAPMYNQILQQAGEIVVNGSRHLQKLQRQQEEEAMQRQMESPQAMGDDPEAVSRQMQIYEDQERRAIEFNQQLQHKQEMHELNIQQKLQDGQTKRYVADAAAAADLLRKNAQAQLQRTPR